MITVTFNDKSFVKQMNNLVSYANGFIDGAVKSKDALSAIVGQAASESLSNYIDSLAMSNPAILHHVYEWAQTGMSSARLFDIQYSVSNNGLSLNGTFSQSKSIKEGSNTPFYDKARIMESRIPVTISPKAGGALSFRDAGQQVFTRKPVKVLKPGGEAVQGQFESAFDDYVSVYLSQSLFDVAGLDYRLKNPTEFKENIRRGASIGKTAGISAGSKWITGGLR